MGKSQSKLSADELADLQKNTYCTLHCAVLISLLYFSPGVGFKTGRSRWRMSAQADVQSTRRYVFILGPVIPFPLFPARRCKDVIVYQRQDWLVEVGDVD